MRPWMTATERCGSHLAVSRSQLSFSEAGQTTTAGIGVVGLERRQRLDGLAQALLVGQEGAPRAQRVAHARPLEGRELAAEHGGGLGDRLAGRRARGADLAQRLVVLGAQLVERLRRRAVDGDVVQGQEGVERLDDPRVDGQRVAGLDGAGQRVEGAGDVGVPEHVEAQEGPVDRLADGQARGAADPRRARATAMQRRAPPSMRAPPRSSASASAPARGQRRQQRRRPRARRRPPAAPRGRSPRACAGPTSRGRRGASSSRRPTQRRSMAASQASTCALVVSSGKRSSTSATWTPAQSSTGAHHSRVSQSKRRCGMPRTTATMCGS